MNKQISFQQVDVFTDKPFKGNPVAVVLDGNSLSTEQMQNIANWTNLSETTFVCKPTNANADYKLRIFTPKNELPFAGHPTIGSAYAVLKSGLVPKKKGCLVQESLIGLVDIVIEDNKLFFTLPEAKTYDLSDSNRRNFADALGINSDDIISAVTVDVGAVWTTIQLPKASDVLNLTPDMKNLASLVPDVVTGVTVFGKSEEYSEPDFEVRSFAPNLGVDEDPVCGSGNGCVATVVRHSNLINKTSYVAGQGSCVGRNGLVEVKYVENGKILLGGGAVTCIEGHILLPTS